MQAYMTIVLNTCEVVVRDHIPRTLRLSGFDRP